MKKVEIYTVNYCPYCKKALEFLDAKGVEYKKFDITENEKEMRDKLKEYYKIESEVTVPQIIVNNVRIGGYDEIKEIDEQGKFEEIFK